MRNATCTTIAPTGSISIIAKCSSGIEPVFSFAYKRRALNGEEFIQVHPLLERLGKQQSWFDEKAKMMLLEGKEIYDIPGISERLLDVFASAHEIEPDDHIRIQAAFQENVDNAVSKTINLTEQTDINEVDKIFRYAHQMGCKGITVYRDKCRQNQIMSAINERPELPANTSSPHARPRKTAGTTIKAQTGCGSLFCTLNKDDKGLFEIFINLGRAGGCPSQSEATARILSIALRSGINPQILIEQLKGIRCLSTMARRSTNTEINVLSCPDAIAQAMEEALGLSDTAENHRFVKKCPDCGQTLRFESGCDVCKNCGYSSCG
jgi:ribonucleoside-diphosphate reductase alpha chain